MTIATMSLYNIYKIFHILQYIHFTIFCTEGGEVFVYRQQIHCRKQKIYSSHNLISVLPLSSPAHGGRNLRCNFTLSGLLL